jgi:pimeloyl-ACP methyl ester carboxylesterase
VTYHQARRAYPGVKALVLAAPADDYAIARRDLGPRYSRWIARARRLVRERKGSTLLIDGHTIFGARRFLSAADPTRPEAALFDYHGRMHHFRRIRVPVLALFGTEEEYACMPIPEMGAILRRKTRSSQFAFVTIPDADHGFHGKEIVTVNRMYRWLERVALSPPCPRT